jgi:hypothetical protein
VKRSIKALVFKTCRLNETEIFFRDKLGLTVLESSPCHFVIHSKGVRILFMAGDKDMAVELYLREPATAEFITLQDPNKIKIIIS